MVPELRDRKFLYTRMDTPLITSLYSTSIQSQSDWQKHLRLVVARTLVLGQINFPELGQELPLAHRMDFPFNI